MSGFRFGLYAEDGDNLGVFHTIVPNWSPGDEFLMGDGLRYRIVAIVAGTDDEAPINALWEVEPVSE